MSEPKPPGAGDPGADPAEPAVAAADPGAIDAVPGAGAVIRAAPIVAGESLARDAWRRLRRNRMAVGCGIGFALIAIACVAGPVIAGWLGVDGTAIDVDLGATPPSAEHWLGTDTLGRDMLVRIFDGGRIALLVALTATLIAVVIGVSYGALAGYVGGRVDYAMMRVVDVLYGFPVIVFVIVVQSTLLGEQKNNLYVLFALIGAVSWLTMARIVRAQVMALRHREFVEAARALGARPLRIVFRHIVPNVAGPVIVYATLSLPFVMLTEAFMSFVGVGVQAPHASWGTLVTEGSSQIIVYPWLLYGPGIAMGATIFALNFLGDGLRDALDPTTRKV